MCEKEKLFLELIEGFQWKYNMSKYRKSLLMFKNDVCLFEIYSYVSFIKNKNLIVKYRLGIEQDLKGFNFYVNNDMIWDLFKSKFDMNHATIRYFITDMFEKYFKFKLVKPAPSIFLSYIQF